MNNDYVLPNFIYTLYIKQFHNIKLKKKIIRKYIVIVLCYNCYNIRTFELIIPK